MVIDGRLQAVAGLVPPQRREALIRVAWPSVAAVPAVAGAGRVLLASIVGAPLAWLLLAPVYFFKVLPFVARRYTLTNRRIMIQRGLKPKATHEVPLAKIDEVRIHKDANSDFFRCGTLEVVSSGQVVLTLPGVTRAGVVPSRHHQCLQGLGARQGRHATLPAKVADHP